MDRASGVIQLAFEPVDFLPQVLAFLSMAIALVLQVAPQALVFAFLSFEFGDQFFARGRAPARLHAQVMPWTDRKYKRKLRRSRRSDREMRVTTR